MEIGDHLASLYVSKSNVEFTSEEFSVLWLAILDKLMTYTVDEHSELRTTAIHTISNLIIHHGHVDGYLSFDWLTFIELIICQK
jgi:hypothetical protein